MDQTMKKDAIIAENQIMTAEQLDGLKKKIEADAMAQMKTTNPLQIMQQGADEFVKKTGRNMTYSEMREMFG
jgi:hypothetical protein